MTAPRLQSLLAMQLLASIAIALAYWYLTPGKGYVLFIGTAFIPIISIVVLFLNRRRPISTYSVSERRYFASSVLIGGGMIVTAQAVQLVNAYIAAETPMVERVWGVTVGLILAALGNAAPKVLPPLGEKTCAAGQTPALQRFAGRSLFLGGVGYIASWSFLPVKWANPIATSICFLAVSFVALRVAAHSRRTRSNGKSA